jgi:chromosome segregation ATPase
MNFQAMTVLTVLIGLILVLWIVLQHFQLLSSRRELFAEQARIRDLARLQAELRDRINLHEEDARQLNDQHAVALQSLDAANRNTTELQSQLLGAKSQVSQLEQSLSGARAAHVQSQSQTDALKIEHARVLKDKEAEHLQRHQAQLDLTEEKINQMTQHTSALTADFQGVQASLRTTQNEHVRAVQLSQELRLKVEQLEALHHETDERLKQQLVLTERSDMKAQQSAQDLATSQVRVSQLQTETQQLQQANRQLQESWQQEKGTWVKALEQQQSVHQAQLQELGQSHQNSLAQALSGAANELQTLEKSLIEKMQGMAQTHAQEHARTQNELTSLQQQFQELGQSRAALEIQLHASHHQKQAVQDRVMDFEKRWSQLSHEQQQAHEMLMNLKSLVSAS